MPIDFESIFKYAPVGMCVSDKRVIQAGNDALGAMFGYAPGALAGQSFQVLYPTQDEYQRTGDRIIPIMNAKGRCSGAM
jgi:PAS domain S-box-containing protein